MIRILLQIALRVRRLYWRIVRPTTRGARAIIVSSTGEVLLLRHRYGNGWVLPGGKSRKGETYEKTIYRELAEEIGIADVSGARRLGEYKNEYEYKKDTIQVFVIDSYLQKPKTHFEIEESRFFDPRALPGNTTPGTQRRIQEWLGERPVQEQW